MSSSSKSQTVFQNLITSYEELDGIWDYIGYDSDERSERVRLVQDRLQKTMLDIIQEENKIRLDLENRIDAKKREIAEACQTLDLMAYFPPRGLTSFMLIKVLDEKAEELLLIKRNRIERFRQLRSEILDYSQKLDLDNFESLLSTYTKKTAEEDSDSELKDFILNESDLEKMAAKVEELSKKYAELQESFAQLCEAIQRIAKEIDYELGQPPLDTTENRECVEEESAEDRNLERMVLSSDKSSSPLSVHLTASTMKCLKSLQQRLVTRKALLMSHCEELRCHLSGIWKRLDVDPDYRADFVSKHSGFKPVDMEALQKEVDRCEALKWQNIDVYITNLRQEANELYSKCFMQTRVDMDSDISPKAVTDLEKEIDRLHSLYDCNRNLFSRVETYRTMWYQYLDLEEKIKDPAILSNRGGILLKTDKERKRLLKELPRLEQEVAESIETFEKSNNTEFRLMGGLTFSEYAAKLWHDFKSTKDTSKYRRPSSAGAARTPHYPASPARSMKS